MKVREGLPCGCRETWQANICFQKWPQEKNIEVVEELKACHELSDALRRACSI
jgi:hypothetical protein